MVRNCQKLSEIVRNWQKLSIFTCRIVPISPDDLVEITMLWKNTQSGKNLETEIPWWWSHCMKDNFETNTKQRILMPGPRTDFWWQVPELTVAPHPAPISPISGIFCLVISNWSGLGSFSMLTINQGEAKEGAAWEGETSKHPGDQHKHCLA